MSTENKQKKGYWVAKANVISQEKQVSYGKLAEEVTKEGEKYMRNVVVEFPSYEDALKAYESEAYQEALNVLDGGAKRLYAVVEGY